MFKLFFYQPNKGAGFMAKRKFANKEYGLKILNDCKASWKDVVESSEMYVKNAAGDWLMMVEVAK